MYQKVLLESPSGHLRTFSAYPQAFLDSQKSLLDHRKAIRQR